MRDRGFALVAVLWALLLLGALAAAVAGGTRTEAALARNGTESAVALAAAEAGVNLAIERLIGMVGVGAIDADGASRFELEVVGVPVRVAMYDTCGRVDLNEAPTELLEAVFAGAGLTPTRSYADRVIEHRRQRRFETEAALRPLLEIDAGVWAHIRDQVTVACRQPGLDRHVAHRDLLARLPGVDPRILEQLVERRAEPVDLARGVSPLPSLGAAETLLLESNRFSHEIVARAAVPGGGTETLTVLVSLIPGASRPYVLLDWRRGS
jgi:general secretion pathway protein K